MVEPGRSIEELGVGAVMIGVLLVGYFIAVKGVFPATRALDAWWKARRSAGEIAGVPEEFDTHLRASERDESDDLDDAVLLTHEKRDDEEDEAFCVDFVAWEKECAVRPRIARYVAKLEERAR
jgi:hypothetical protein